ncbi:hypothetical protein INT48_000310 [Thamnidium elegans]|uniref:Uncharacterized protein n=1 Tax=Thamnidium elegans TaxID=101142 RepID=A0A8H7SHC9_9FUNG|nr:hypothetical protein INT48_000310 [Thamnidium elegans]
MSFSSLTAEEIQLNQMALSSLSAQEIDFNLDFSLEVESTLCVPTPIDNVYLIHNSDSEPEQVNGSVSPPLVTPATRRAFRVAARASRSAARAAARSVSPPLSRSASPAVSVASSVVSVASSVVSVASPVVPVASPVASPVVPVASPAVPVVPVFSTYPVDVALGETINMSFQDYSAHCINAIDFEERLDLHLNGLYRDPSGIKHPIVVEMDLDSTTEPSLVFTQDIDAFIASNTRTLPVNDGIRCKVTLAPSYKSKMRLLEYGTYTIRNEVVNIKDTPHTMLCVVEGYGLLKCYISFPGMYTAYNIDSSSSEDSEDETPTTIQYLFLSASEQEAFVDLVYLPAIKQVCGDYALSNISSSFKQAFQNGYSDDPKEFLSSTIIKGAISVMRTMTDNNPSLRRYKGFLISCSSFGSKQEIFGDIVLSNILGNGVIDWTILDRTKVLLDVATTVTNIGRISSLFLKHNCQHVVAGLYGVKQEEKKRLFQSALSSFGGMSARPTTVAEGPTVVKPRKLIVYNCMKRTFSGKEGHDVYTGFHGKHFTPEGLWSGSNQAIINSNDFYQTRFADNKTSRYSLRVEGRYSAAEVSESFLEEMKLNAFRIYDERSIMEVDTASYMGYLDCRRALLIEMASFFIKKLGPNDLSAVVLISYILSSLVLAPNQKYRECRDYILANRCRRNEVLFLPKSFSFVGGSLRFSSRFPENILKAYIPRAFSSAVTDVITYSLSRNFKNAVLKDMVRSFTFPSTPSSSFLGLGQTSLTTFYFGKANEIFLKYGLTAESCGRFLELYFQEQVVLMGNFVKPEWKGDSLGMECFEYDSPVDAFISVKKSKYMKTTGLSRRFQYALP